MKKGFTLYFRRKQSKPSGFTLIELLVTIAIIGVLAGVVLIAIDPAQQIARAQDAGKKSELSQVAGALEAYSVSHNASYVLGQNLAMSGVNEGCAGTASCPDGVPTNSSWDDVLTQAGEIKIIRTQSMVYDSDTAGSRFRIYVKMSATKLEGEKGQQDTVNSSSCGFYTYGPGAEVYYIYDSEIGQTFWFCSSAGPTTPYSIPPSYL